MTPEAAAAKELSLSRQASWALEAVLAAAAEGKALFTLSRAQENAPAAVATQALLVPSWFSSQAQEDQAAAPPVPKTGGHHSTRSITEFIETNGTCKFSGQEA